jgi:hypothetical protein
MKFTENSLVCGVQGNYLGGWLFDLGVGSGGIRGVMFYFLFIFAFEGKRFFFFLVYRLVWFTLLSNVGWFFLFVFPLFLQVFLCFQCVHLP